ncbi:MAG: EamA family transporter [Flavobacteriaceae bacterium]|nr:EamA family transporter [Flavobacteriaceae bacterium]
MQKSNINHYVLLHFIVFIWGFTAILGELIELDALPLVWYRVTMAVVFIAVYMVISKKPFKLNRKQFVRYTFGGILICLHWVAFFSSIKESTISIALTMLSTGTLFAAFIEPIVFKRKVKLSEIVCGVLIIIGVSVIFRVNSQYTLGIMYGLAASLLSATFSVCNGLWVKKNPPTTITFYQLFLGIISLSIYMAYQGYFTASFFVLTTEDWIYLGILSSVCTAYAFIASVKVMRFLSPYTVMISVNLEPIYGILLAVIIFDEAKQMTPAFYMGTGIILLSMVTNAVFKRFEKKKINNN